MMHSSLLITVFYFFLLLLPVERSLVKANCQRDQTVGRMQSNNLSSFNNDFENGVVEPWIELSEASTKWKIENKTSPWQMDNAAPTPLKGQNYLRVDRGTSLSYSAAILRSPQFKLSPDIHNVTFSFSFWIRSKWPQFTNLELYVAKDGNENLLLNLYNYSDVNNLAWQSRSVSLIDETSSTLTLVFYAYCGLDAEDAVAIDDLRFNTQQETTTSTKTTSSSLTQSTTGISTTSTPPETTSMPQNQTTTIGGPSEIDCLDYFKDDTRMTCWTLEAKCYCFFRNTVGLSWINADAYCKSESMTLIGIETEEEDKLIYNHVKTIPEMSSARYWTSGKYQSEENDTLWEWARTEPFQPITYTNWSPGEPQANGPGYCLYLDFRIDFNSGYWKDLLCIESKKFICESIS